MVAPETDKTLNQKENEPMATDKTSKGESSKRESAPRSARKATASSRGSSRYESGASRAFDFMRDRLKRDAGRVSERDINALRSSVPKKLEEVDTSQLRKELEWIGELVGRVKTLWDMLFDREFTIDWKSKALMGAALLYFVLPTDLTPDFIPGIGYIDDALVLATVWRLLQEKIDEYVSFRRKAVEPGA
jgi:uncharacterized membrane protein YkvA (DUF1232 family)